MKTRRHYHEEGVMVKMLITLQIKMNIHYAEDRETVMAITIDDYGYKKGYLHQYISLNTKSREEKREAISLLLYLHEQAIKRIDGGKK